MSSQVIQEILSGKKKPDNYELMALTRKGLPRSTVDDVARAFGMSGKEFCRLLPVSWRTLQRYPPDHLLDSHLTDHLVRLVMVFAQVFDMFDAPEDAAEWLKTPIRALGNKQPIEFLDTSAGIEIVRTILLRIQHGVFS